MTAPRPHPYEPLTGRLVLCPVPDLVAPAEAQAFAAELIGWLRARMRPESFEVLRRELARVGEE